MLEGALLDTSFFIRFLNEDDPLFENAEGYFRYFLENGITLFISTISIAEYCVGGSIEELPLRNMKIVPFNITHSLRTGNFANHLFQARKEGELTVEQRPIIINDAKLFAQADAEKQIDYFVTSDTRSINIYNNLIERRNLHFKIVDIRIDHKEQFGLLNF